MRRLRKLKALAAFFLGILWFVVTCLGIAVLAIPQVIIRAYGSDKDPIEAFVSFMEEVFQVLKES